MIENKFLEDRLLDFGRKNQDAETTIYALWSKLRFSQYVIAEKQGV